MSTFDGRVSEFPEIRVDFFRSNPSLRPPLACFLSHVHSDHLAGLESLRSPFVYCSAATREMLLRLERYPCRINYAKGILERRVQTYKHLKNLLKPIPLETPTTLELEPGRHICVTLFDANHCTGAVMFLFEGDGKAVLYTGDIRSEPWHVNSIARSPCLVAYSSHIKTLDKIYLDTSFLGDVEFPPKADGIQELLRKVATYPEDTVFHFQAWTFGYEQVWIALAKALNTQIHVDDYKLQLYKSLVAKDSKSRYGAQFHMGPEAAALVGFMCGNTEHPGCLTDDESVRVHSCEKGNYCSAVRNANVVHIRPIITRLPDGRDVAEVGVGGGLDDLEREAELDLPVPEAAERLLDIIFDGAPSLDDKTKSQIQKLLSSAMTAQRNISLDLDVSEFDDNNEALIAKVLGSMAKRASALHPGSPTPSRRRDPPTAAAAAPVCGETLPRIITFPYSRHSSYPELCHLVRAFRPRDIWPCTVNEAEWIKNDISIDALFGDYCSGSDFEHDRRMAALPAARRKGQGGLESQDSQTTHHSAADSMADWDNISEATDTPRGRRPSASDGRIIREDHADVPVGSPPPSVAPPLRKRDFDEYHREDDGLDYSSRDSSRAAEDALLLDSQGSEMSESNLEIRREAFHAVIERARNGRYKPVGLLSTTDHHSVPEVELG